MAQRIARHQAERGVGWHTIETSDPAVALAGLTQGAALIDCLTLWLAGLGERHEWAVDPILAEVEILAQALAASPVPVAVVTNEVGSGIVPANALARSFQDLQGWTNQRIARAAHQVHLVVCGRSIILPPPR